MLALMFRYIFWKANRGVAVGILRERNVLNIEIGNYQIVFPDILDLQCGSAVFDRPDLVTRVRKDLFEGLRQVVVVVDYQYSSMHRRCRQQIITKNYLRLLQK